MEEGGREGGREGEKKVRGREEGGKRNKRGEERKNTGRKRRRKRERRIKDVISISTELLRTYNTRNTLLTHHIHQCSPQAVSVY